MASSEIVPSARVGVASGLDVPELSSRLQFIRDEIDAREEVAEIGAERRGVS